MKKGLFSLILLLLFLTLKNTARGQSADLNISITHPIASYDTVSPGDIVSLSTDATQSGKLIRSKVSYDDKLFGVVVDKSAIVLKVGDSPAVARTGKAEVNVITLNGAIAVGDYLTSSPIPGYGQKATEIAGFVLGVAISDFSEKDGREILYQGQKIQSGKVKVELGIGPANPGLAKSAQETEGTLKSILSSVIYNLKVSKQLEKVIRYIMAALITSLTLIINFRTFGRNITKGIEAIGRNPLARVSIETMIVLNIILITILSLAGIALSFVILSI